MEYANGRITAPNTKDASYDKWKMENSIVMTWLVHSMIPEIGEFFGHDDCLGNLGDHSQHLFQEGQFCPDI